MDATANIMGSIIDNLTGNRTGCPFYHDESGLGTDEVVLIVFISICIAISLYLCGICAAQHILTELLGAYLETRHRPRLMRY
jgi:hypothetical protein